MLRAKLSLLMPFLSLLLVSSSAYSMSVAQFYVGEDYQTITVFEKVDRYQFYFSDVKGWTLMGSESGYRIEEFDKILRRLALRVFVTGGFDGGARGAFNCVKRFARGARENIMCHGASSIIDVESALRDALK